MILMLSASNFLKQKCKIIPLLGLYFNAIGCFSFDMSEAEARCSFSQEESQLYFHNYTIEGQRIRYVSLDKHPKNEKKPFILFVHGSPGGWSAYIDYLKDPFLQKAARLVSVDRIGYGGSDRGHVEPSMAKQARFLQPILASYARYPTLLVGHSLGASIIVRMAMDYPQLIRGLVLIAGPFDPEIEKPAWYNRVGDWWSVRWLLPTDLHTSNKELLPLRAELEKMLSLWKKIRMPVTAIHGRQDTLVPPGHIAFLRKMLDRTRLRVIVPEDEGHFILWQNRQMIIREILNMLQAPSRSQNETS